MKILTVSTLDAESGAAKAAYRLHRSLLSEDIDSGMLVQNKKSDDHTVTGPSSKMEMMVNIARPTLDRIPLMFYRQRRQVEFYPAFLPFSNILKKINQISPDIVHLHWINGGMIKIEDIAKIKAPIVWSLHDMWPFTGGCHYDEECGLYRTLCGPCKILGSSKENDLSRKIFSRKQNVFSKVENLTIVGLSRWMADCAKESKLLGNKNVINLPNPIDTNIFKSCDKEKSRELWNLPKDKKLLLFGAMSATSDPRKGFDELSKALQKIEDQNTELVIFGSSKPKKAQNFGFKTHYLGHLIDEVSLVTLYSAADLVIIPSLQENLSNVAIESMACATPVVGFDIGGNSDIVDHLRNGYLANSFDPADLANGIKWILGAQNYDELCADAREKVIKNFDSHIVAKKYIDLYENILRRNHGA